MKTLDVRFLEIALLVVGLSLVSWWARTMSETHAFQSESARRLDALRYDVSDEDAAVASPDEGLKRTRVAARRLGLVGRLVIPRAGISAVIAEGDDSGTLRRAIGHVPGTAYPGEHGNSTLAGHRDTFFRGLERVRNGDLIRVLTPDGVFAYRVEGIDVVSPRNVSVMRDGPRPTLTLVTCYPFRYVGPAPQRFVVRARAIGPGAPDMAG